MLFIICTLIRKDFILFQITMNKELVIRVRGPEGQYRFNVMSRDTYGELLLQVDL